MKAEVDSDIDDEEEKVYDFDCLAADYLAECKIRNVSQEGTEKIWKMFTGEKGRRSLRTGYTKTPCTRTIGRRLATEVGVPVFLDFQHRNLETGKQYLLLLVSDST